MNNYAFNQFRFELLAKCANSNARNPLVGASPPAEGSFENASCGERDCNQTPAYHKCITEHVAAPPQHWGKKKCRRPS